MGKRAKSGKSKKGLIFAILGVLVLGGGGFFGAAFMGVLKIPGITPKSKLAKKAPVQTPEAKAAAEKAAADKKKAEEAAKVAAAAPPVEEEVVEPSAPEPDLKKGAEALAEIWNGLPEAKILEICKTWPVEDVARVLPLLDTKKAAGVLGLMEAKRASEVSEEIQRQAATPKEAQA